ncbi:P-loop containing nucleoside triphosphate hydrolase protein [Teratosphaeria nubilosa]|uniref:RNA helicase n=1 Tax=Teratosphaeria nubilosa TaxID=161662 RepID=A0A6G1LGC4_9PEZI|nr:P-loop containing nucleoside triphosphate hydrolase protein [Teratosphaeria nubilosa]
MARSPRRRDDLSREYRDDRNYSRDRYDDRDRRDRERDRDRERERDRDRGYSRRSRSRGRYDEYDRRHDMRRDRSRDRDRYGKRSREASPVRGSRPERRGHVDDYDNRDRKRLRYDDSSPRRSHRGSSRDRDSNRASSVRPETPRSRPSTAEDPEKKAREAKAARLARVAAWKEKTLRDKGQAQDSPATPASPSVQSPGSVQDAATANNSAAPTQRYAGKFDPKAVSRKAAAAMERARTLEGNVAVPAKPVPSANRSVMTSGARSQPIAKGSSTAKPKGFGLSKVAGSASQPAPAAKSAALEDEDQVERRLERLPDLPNIGDALNSQVHNEAEDAGKLSDDNEEEALREAAQKRAQDAQGDFPMTSGNIETAAADVAMADAEEEIDPLDAFMNFLNVPVGTSTFSKLSAGKGSKDGGRQVFNSDDEDELDAVGDSLDDLQSMTKKKKKDIPTVNHAKVAYEPFRKAFYSEPIELADMSKEDLEILRADLDNINVGGRNAPKPILKFSQGGFGAQILDVIRELKFEKPTPIQAQTLPCIMSGRDTIGIAKTGSGKTIAYLLPMFRHIKDQRPLENLDGPIGLVLAPTRELATQIHRDCKPFLRSLNLRAVCAYGGAPIKDQIAELKRGAEIVVCTPGRMIDLLAANNGRVTNLKRVTYVVLDEADRMFDMGFEPQITKVLNNVRPDRQTVLFSATFPRNMEALARKTLKNPLQVLVGGKSVVAPEITQIIEVRGDDSKFRRLLQLLGELHDTDEDARSLIFVERQETADSLLKDLNQKGYPVVSIHGGREQIDRDQAISDFKAGHIPVMVATSVAARGLDVKQLKLVVNFDSPNHHEDYVHRVGRTGRAGNKGTAVTFVTPEQDRFATFLIKALTDAKQEVPEALRLLDEGHKEKVRAGEARKAGSGFGGHGIEKFEAQRNAEKALQRKQFKTGDEEEEEEEEGDKKTDKKQSEVDKLVAKATGQVKDRDAIKAESPVAAPTLKAHLAHHLDEAMKVRKVEKPDNTGPQSNDPLNKVTAAAAAINARLGGRGATRPGVPIDNRGPDAGAFHATLEINDFPQKARWAVTNRTNVAKILESTGTSITTKGNYYAEGKVPGLGEQPKLYILVEGDTEVVVESAMRELTRLLREGTLADMESSARVGAGGGGRYSVV